MSEYVNVAVAEMRGIPYSQLSPEQKKRIKIDGKRRKKLIDDTMKQVLENNKSAFNDIKELEDKITKIYKSVAKDLISKINNLRAEVEKNGGEWDIKSLGKFNRLNNLLGQIYDELLELGEIEIGNLEKKLIDTYKDQYIRQVYALGQSIPISMSTDAISHKMIRDVISYPYDGAMFSDRVWYDKTQLMKNLKQGLTNSLILGESMGKVADRIEKSIDTARFNSLRLARTEIMRMSYIAESKAMKEHDINKVEYWATIPSERTCSHCGKLHKKVFEHGKEPMLPTHPQCRCTYLPVIEDFNYNPKDEMVELSPDTSYNEFKEVMLDKDKDKGKEPPKVDYTHPLFKKDTIDMILEKNHDGDDIVNIYGEYARITTDQSKKWLKAIQKVESREEFYKLYEKAESSKDFDIQSATLFRNYHKAYEMKDEIFNVSGYKMAITKKEGLDLGNESLSISGELTESEKRSIINYTGSWSSPMNFHFRNKETSTDKDLLDAISNLDRAIEKSVIKEDMMLYRGASANIFSDDLLDLAYDNPKELQGYTIQDLGYMSTSTGYKSKFDADVIMQIKAPKGTKGIWAEPMSTSKGEMEVILKRGTTLEIKDAKLNEDTGILNILLEVVGND